MVVLEEREFLTSVSWLAMVNFQFEKVMLEKLVDKGSVEQLSVCLCCIQKSAKIKPEKGKLTYLSLQLLSPGVASVLGSKSCNPPYI